MFQSQPLVFPAAPRDEGTIFFMAGLDPAIIQLTVCLVMAGSGPAMTSALVEVVTR